MPRPNSRRNLDFALQRAYGTRYVQARAIMANAIVGQLLPAGVVKGGTSIKLRYGVQETRFTTDLDTARVGTIKEFQEELGASLAVGWEGFTGRLVKLEQAHPKNVPGQYVMQPYDVKLSYNGKPWLTVPLEVGHNELGDADAGEPYLSPAVVEIFQSVGLPAPAPTMLMPLHFQVSQKLHGLTEPNSKRAHDLIDLQIIAREETLDLSKIKTACVELFKYRQMQVWPPVILKHNGWDELYEAQLEGLNVLKSVDDAIVWGNEFILAIDAAA